jgi:hypothetical protein
MSFLVNLLSPASRKMMKHFLADPHFVLVTVSLKELAHLLQVLLPGPVVPSHPEGLVRVHAQALILRTSVTWHHYLTD